MRDAHAQNKMEPTSRTHWGGWKHLQEGHEGPKCEEARAGWWREGLAIAAIASRKGFSLGESGEVEERRGASIFEGLCLLWSCVVGRSKKRLLNVFSDKGTVHRGGFASFYAREDGKLIAARSRVGWEMLVPWAHCSPWGSPLFLR